ncbi:MAG TPA: GAF domain-containing protein [candidate division Zixibacteria bacterium]|nr:GAF domain-containing protein [candidate division Zixibacteria bacterium]
MGNTGERIIIIDDEKRMCDSLYALLTGDGYEVETFQRSPEAAEAIRTRKVDLVISDIKMPGMDGIELLRRVKEVDDGIPVILMTGYGSLDTAIQAVGAGAYDYLLKPVEFSYLELAVNRALEKRRADIARLQLLEELRLSNMILKRRMDDLNALYEAGKSIGSTANLHELLRQIVVLASTVTEAQVGSIMLLDEAGEYLTIEAAIGLDEDIVAATRLSIGSSIAGWVAREGEPLIVRDVEADPRFRRINKERYGAASLLCCPLRIKNKVIGVINLANKAGGETFNDNDLRLLTTFASQAAVAVDDANQFERNRRRLIEFEILNELSGELTEIQSMHDFCQLLVTKLTRVFPIDCALWFNWEPGRKTLVAAAASGGPDLRPERRSEVTLGPLELDEDILADIPRLSAAVAADIRAHQALPAPETAFLALPVKRRGELAHIFYFAAAGKKPYSADDISIARLVVSQAALLFEREQSLLNMTRLLTMGNMISEISHDLRKPLTSIKGSLQVLAMKHPEIAAQSELLNAAEEEVHRMNELVRELVDFSNPNKYQTEKIDLRRIVARAAELVGPDLRKKNIAYSARFAEADWDVIVNKNQILEAFLNLLINAIDAIPGPGQIRVEGLLETPPHRKEPYLAVRVADSGCGIKKENLSRIFERYYTTKDTGTGLGLSVVERIISAHNGTLAVQSEEGRGATFSLYFPYHN